MKYVFVLATIMGVGCRPDHREPQAVAGDKIEVPKFRGGSETPFQLQGPGTVSYAGNLVLFHPDASGEQMRAIVGGTIAVRASYGRLASLVKKFDVAGLRETRAQAMADLDTFRREARNKTDDMSERRSRAEKWVSEELQQHANSEAHYAELTDVFQKYCDAKVWELAVNPGFASRKYLERPSPLQLCESYYRSLSYFSDDQGECAPDGRGKSYFKCLWSEALPKTRWLLDGSLSADQVAAIRNLVDRRGEDLRLTIAGEKSHISPAYHGRLLSAALLLTKVSPTMSCKRKLILPELCEVFEGASPRPAHRGKNDPLTRFPPKDYIDVMQSLTSYPGIPFEIEGKALFVSLMAYFGERYNRQPSESDAMFHRPVGEALSPDHTELVKGQQAQLRQHFDGVFSRLTPEDLAAITQAEGFIAKMGEDIDSKLEELSTLAGHYKEQRARTIRAIGAPGASLMFETMSAKIERTEQVFKITISIGKGAPMTQCLQVGSWEPCVDFREGMLADWSEKSVRYDEQTNKLIFHVALSQPERMGFRLSSPSDTELDYFNRLDPELYSLAELRFELEPSMLGDDNVDIITGLAEIWRDGSPLVGGGVSLLEAMEIPSKY